MARNNKMEKTDVYLLAAIAIFSLLLIAVELMPIPVEVVAQEDAPKLPIILRSGAIASVRIPPTPVTTIATVNVAA
ncbi:MAG: hypothetical protein GOV02_01060 [Candidatus Aenigmarchaeota archaeon]|nr:hypothetical protein [Candidatus Aenigmarchaeota archaeon]